MEQQNPVTGTDEIQRVETALNALSAKKAANDAMRKASHDLPSSAAYSVDSHRSSFPSWPSTIVLGCFSGTATSKARA